MNMHVMDVLDRTGHTSVEWDPDEPMSVKAARAKFDELRGQGYSAFAIEADEDEGVTVEKKGRRIDAFDPRVGKVMMIPHLQGG